MGRTRGETASTAEGEEAEPFDVLPTRWVVVGAVTTVATTTLAMVVLLLVARGRPELQFDAIKTGLTVGAGTGGVFALLLAVRRQWHEERKARRDVQLAAEILKRIASPAGGQDTTGHWPDMRLNLAGACLVRFDISDCSLGSADFSDARFVGPAYFLGTRFTQFLWTGIEMRGCATFKHATFEDNAEFFRARFDEVAVFHGARFRGLAAFQEVRFRTWWHIEKATFERGINLHGARFGQEVVESSWPDGWRIEEDLNGPADFPYRAVRQSSGGLLKP